MENRVCFLGAGSGDPELITVKGMKRLQESDLVIYAGSLVNPDLLKYTNEKCEKINSASLDLEQVIAKTHSAWKEGKTVTRLHTGDPSLFGAIKEQMRELDKLSVPCFIIPGVSSFLSAAAELKCQYTLPGISQSLIITRMEGRTPVSNRDSIEKLASHGLSMAVFLSVSMIEDLCAKLKSGYRDNTPVAVIYKSSWPDQKIIRGRLMNIAEKVKENKINKTALILIGDFLKPPDNFDFSKLYDKAFKHMYRK